MATVKIAIYPKSVLNTYKSNKRKYRFKFKSFNVGSIKPDIVDPETTNILLTSTVKYNKNNTSLTADTLKTNVITKLTNMTQKTYLNLMVFLDFLKLLV